MMREGVAAACASYSLVRRLVLILSVRGSQLSRDIEKRGTLSEPQLSDLRDSGSIEQDGTIIIFPRNLWQNPNPQQILEFPENRNPHTLQPYDELKAVPMRFHILKNRNGPIGITPKIKWTKSTGRYQTLIENENHR